MMDRGIGLNSGAVVAGSVGGAGRLEFSVIGDAVTARVESATRQTGDRVLVADRTKELLQSAGMEFVERQGLTLKSKTKPVAVYAPVPTSAPVLIANTRASAMVERSTALRRSR